jgi:hypothetical protein
MVEIFYHWHTLEGTASLALTIDCFSDYPSSVLDAASSVECENVIVADDAMTTRTMKVMRRGLDGLAMSFITINLSVRRIGRVREGDTGSHTRVKGCHNLSLPRLLA